MHRAARMHRRTENWSDERREKEETLRCQPQAEQSKDHLLPIGCSGAAIVWRICTYAAPSWSNTRCRLEHCSAAGNLTSPFSSLPLPGTCNSLQYLYTHLGRTVPMVNRATSCRCLGWKCSPPTTAWIIGTKFIFMFEIARAFT